MPTQPNRIRLCLVSPPGAVRDATYAYVAQIETVSVVTVLSGALSATQVLPRLSVDLVLLDASVPEEEAAALLRWLGDHCPTTRSVVTTLNSSQIHRAIALGADYAMRRDELPLRLPVLVDELLMNGSPRFETLQSSENQRTSSV